MRISILTVAFVVASATRVSAQQGADLPRDPAFWQHLDTLPPTPRGKGYLPGVPSGKSVQFRYPVPKPMPPAYQININNIVALRGTGTLYQVEIHIDSPTGPVLHRGPEHRDGYAFNAEDLSGLDATALLRPEHVAQGFVDVWATATVEGDQWTTYRDSPKGRRDLYALAPDPAKFAEWAKARRRRAEMLRRGICVVPHPQHVEVLPDDFRITEGTTVALLGRVTEDDRRTAKLVRAEFSRCAKRDVRLDASARASQVRLVMAEDAAGIEGAVGFKLARDPGPQGYALQVTTDRVVASAYTTVGLYYAAQTLTQLAGVSDGAPVVRGVRILDRPDLKRRMMQYDIARGNTVNVEYWKRFIRELSRLKVNEIMLYMEDDYHFEKHPYLGRPDTFTPEKARELVAYAREHHVALVPQIESLGHAAALLRHDELSDLRLGGKTWAICPHAERTLPVLDDLYAELCAAFPQSKLFHVGGDEVWGFAADPRCAETVKSSGEEGVYAFHMNNLHKLLAKRGRKMAFWGDEVLHHPKVADTLTRDCVVFDWHYGNQKAYPSLKFFQDRGFKEIYACPAVHGYFDVYPQYRMAFGNISGFAKAAVEHGIDGICCTTWGMNRGGNVENYLYGLAYAAECAWSSKETDRGFFDDRFASVWLGLADAKGAREHIDRAFWFAWRRAKGRPFWQQLFQVSKMFFGPYTGFLDKLDDAGREGLAAEAVLMEELCGEALDSIKHLHTNGDRNRVTLDALAHAARIHAHVADKITTMAAFASRYRTGYVAEPRSRETLLAAVDAALTDLRKLRGEYPAFEEAFGAAIASRCGDPNDLRMLRSARDKLDAYLTKIGTARQKMVAGAPVPDPSALGLGPRTLARIWAWQTSDINPSDKTNQRRVVIEVTKHIRSSGVYEIEWDYTRGQDGLDITSTGLFTTRSIGKTPDDLTPLSVDKHHGFTGGADRHNRYRVRLEKLDPSLRYFVVGMVYNQRDFSTSGSVWLRRSWDE